MKRFLYLGGVLFLFVICSGCGDTFRPIIVPNPPKFPNPAAAHSILILSDNGTVTGGVETAQIGSAMTIDVSGDTEESQRNIGIVPIHAVQETANQVIVANQSVPGSNQDSLTRLTFSGTSISTVTTISMPTGSAPNFVATTETAQVYVSMPNYVPPSVAVMNTVQGTMVHTIPVGLNPVAIVETPNATKLYVANYGDSTVDGFNTLDQSQRTITGSFNAPLWISARSDSQRVFVLNGNGVVSTIDTSQAISDTVIDTSISVPGASYMWYDVVLNRLYIPAGQQLTIVDVSQSTPTKLATISIPPFSVFPAGSVPATAIAVTSLPDASRAYVGSYALLPTNLTIPSVTGDGTNATYTYTVVSGHDVAPGTEVTISGLFSGGTELTDFEGTFQVSSVISGTSACPTTCFQIANTNTLSATPVSGSGAGSNVFPQVTVINATNFTVKTNIVIPGFPDATNPANPIYYVPVCATTRDQVGPTGGGFRMMMAAGGDSTRAYLSTCDGGNVNIIQTSNDSYYFNLPAPFSARSPIPPSVENPPQNPVFMIAGP